MYLYAMYDKLSKRLDKPFLAENDAVAMRMFNNTIIKMKKEELEYSKLTMIRICQFHNWIIEEYDNERKRTGYVEVIKEDTSFDLLNIPEDLNEDVLIDEESKENRKEFNKYLAQYYNINKE